MYTKVKVAGHPVHPMLVGFPVAFYSATLVCFAVRAFGGDALWFRIGVYCNLAGVITAAAAALPGFIDWNWGIPANTTAKATGRAHMFFNVGALLVFLTNLLIQWPHRLEPVPAVGWSVVLALLGVLLTVAAGFLGWKMVQVHHVGIQLTPEQQRLEARAPVPPAPLPKPRTGHDQPAT